MISTQDTPKFAYLRNRPFLIIEIYTVPSVTRKDNAASHATVTHTERKGWMKDGKNTSLVENPMLVEAVKDKHLCTASVIIDLLQDSLIKNRLDDSDAEVLAHFKQKYRGMIEQGRNSWGEKTASQLRDFESFKRSHVKTAGAQEHGSQSAHVARAVSRKV